MRFIENIPIWGTSVDEGALSQIKTCALTADKVAMMADHHKGYAVPIGGVVAYRDSISPSGVGYDIACGNKAVLTDMPASVLRSDISRIMDEVFSVISFGVGRKNEERVDHELFSNSLGWKTDAAAPLKEMAHQQLGTVGSGNHYVDLFTDELDRVWIGVHFGSRGLGHKIATWFLEAAGAANGMDAAPCVLKVASDLGTQYIEAMKLGALHYLQKPLDMIGHRSPHGMQMELRPDQQRKDRLAQVAFAQEDGGCQAEGRAEDKRKRKSNF